MLRISQASTTPAQIVLRLEGQVTGRWVDELRRECARVLASEAHGGSRLVLDLAEVASIDAAGRALFRELSIRRGMVTNCSMYVAELLKGVANVDR
jgi:hypothetical protein